MKQKIRQHKFTCDRCGYSVITGDIYNERNVCLANFPRGWRSLGDRHLCDLCAKDTEKTTETIKRAEKQLDEIARKYAKEEKWTQS